AAQVFLLINLCALPPAFAARPYEAQVAGFVAVVLRTLITGEFAGRKPSQVDADLHRPVCRPGDYYDLRAAANDRDAFDALHRRCDFVEARVDATHLHSIAYLPNGYCEILKEAFQTMLAQEVYSVPSGARAGLVLDYKGSRLEIGGGNI